MSISFGLRPNMGNRIINIKDVAKVEKEPYFSNYYQITMKNGTSYNTFIDEIPLLRLENYLHMPYSKVVSDQIKAQISRENKNCVPIVLNNITFVFQEPNQPQNSKKLAVNIRNVYINDIIAYHKLLVHRGAFESLITKVFENKEEIYTTEFQNRFNDERDKLLELLKKKTNAFSSKL